MQTTDKLLTELPSSLIADPSAHSFASQSGAVRTRVRGYTVGWLGEKAKARQRYPGTGGLLRVALGPFRQAQHGLIARLDHNQPLVFRSPTSLTAWSRHDQLATHCKCWQIFWIPSLAPCFDPSPGTAKGVRDPFPDETSTVPSQKRRAVLDGSDTCISPAPASEPANTQRKDAGISFMLRHGPLGKRWLSGSPQE